MLKWRKHKLLTWKKNSSTTRRNTHELFVATTLRLLSELSGMEKKILAVEWETLGECGTARSSEEHVQMCVSVSKINFLSVCLSIIWWLLTSVKNMCVDRLSWDFDKKQSVGIERSSYEDAWAFFCHFGFGCWRICHCLVTFIRDFYGNFDSKIVKV